MKLSTCHCGARITWARNTKGHFIPLETPEVEDGLRYVISKDEVPRAFITGGKGHRKHVCENVEPDAEQGELGL